MSLENIRKKCIIIMTWNIYIGADLTPLINTTPQQLPAVVTEVFNQLEQTDFPARAKAIARQICQTEPDLIGLQEVALWTVQSPQTKSVLNFLNVLLAELKKLALDYRVVAVNKNFRDKLPSSTGEVIGVLDRDVLLAMCQLPIKFSNIQEDNFQSNLVVPIGSQPFTILRGWSAVDIDLYEQKFRLVNTHLEGESLEVRMAQAEELLTGPGATDLPLIFIGDFNSNAADSGAPTYHLLINAGFNDAWELAGKGPGFTAFQARDLLNPVSSLSERIDLILFRNGLKVKRVNRVGERQRDRTPCGLWPSDHAGVVATLNLSSARLCTRD